MAAAAVLTAPTQFKAARAVVAVMEAYRDARVQFVMKVGELAVSPQNAEALLSLGALQLLLPLAQDSMASVRSAATLSLGRLANVSHAWSHHLVQRNVLPSLCKALTGTNRHHKRAAAYLVKAVSRHAGAELAEAGVLPLLTECLLDAMLAVRETAACALGHVVKHSGDLAMRVVETGAVRLLVTCLQDEAVARIALSVLSDVARHSLLHATAVAAAQDEAVARIALSVLSDVARHSLLHATAVADAGGITAAVSLSASASLPSPGTLTSVGPTRSISLAALPARLLPCGRQQQLGVREVARQRLVCSFQTLSTHPPPHSPLPLFPLPLSPSPPPFPTLSPPAASAGPTRSISPAALPARLVPLPARISSSGVVVALGFLAASSLDAALAVAMQRYHVMQRWQGGLRVGTLTWVRMSGDGWGWVGMGRDGWGWVGMGRDGWMGGDGRGWVGTGGNGLHGIRETILSFCKPLTSWDATSLPIPSSSHPPPPFPVFPVPSLSETAASDGRGMSGYGWGWVWMGGMGGDGYGWVGWVGMGRNGWDGWGWVGMGGDGWGWVGMGGNGSSHCDHKRAAAYLVKAVSRHAGTELAEAGVLPLLTECLLAAMLAVRETAACAMGHQDEAVARIALSVLSGRLRKPPSVARPLAAACYSSLLSPAVPCSTMLAPSLHFTLQMLSLHSSAAARTAAGAAAISQAGGLIAQSSQHCADLSHCFATVASPHRNQQDPSAEAEIAGSNDQEADSLVLSGAGDDGSRSGAGRPAGSSDGRSDGDDGFRVRSEPWIFNLTELPPDSTAARLSEESKENMWLLHQKDPGHWSVARLAREYRVRQQRVHAILWLKDLEKKMEEEQGKPLDDSIAKEFEKQHGSYDKAVGERHVKIYPSEAVDSLPEGPERVKLLLQESEKEEMWKLDEFVKRMEFNKKQSVDATDQAAIKAAITSIDEECPIDILQCNAGIVRTGLVEDLSADDVQSQVHTNFLGSVYPVQAVLPSMKARVEAGEKPGAIVFTCSLAALVSLPDNLIHP
ncbi:unnamed protein product [Closterium sp. Naga37s-1]|nr:unnamed protein product [Closterium sp. Naga37s-1]